MKNKLHATTVNVSDDELETILSCSNDVTYWLYKNNTEEMCILETAEILDKESTDGDGSQKVAAILDNNTKYEGWRYLDLIHLNLG